VDVELEESVVADVDDEEEEEEEEEEEDEDDDITYVDTSSINIPSSRLTNTGSPSQVKHIVLERGPDGLGFSIVGGHGSPHGNLPIYVKTVFERGAAVTSGLKRGDQILAVNTIPCEGLTHHEAVTLLKNVKGSVNLSILS